jgi:hypothetical protein
LEKLAFVSKGTGKTPLEMFLFKISALGFIAFLIAPSPSLPFEKGGWFRPVGTNGDFP